MAPKYIKGMLVSALFGAFTALTLLHFAPLVSADFLPLPGAAPGSEALNVPKPEGATGLEKAENFLGPLARTIRIVLGAVAVLLITIAGLGMAMGADNEETVNTQKAVLTYSIMGLLLVSIAGPLAGVFDFRAGNFMASPDAFVDKAQLFDRTTLILTTFIRYLLGGLASLTFVMAGGTLVLSRGDDEAIGRAKQNMGLAAGGLFFVFISDLLIRRLFFNARFNNDTGETQVEIDVNQITSQLAGFANILISFVGPVMILGLVIGGLMYITAGGDESRMELAKKVLLNSTIGIVVIYGAFAIVSTVIAGQF